MAWLWDINLTKAEVATMSTSTLVSRLAPLMKNGFPNSLSLCPRSQILKPRFALTSLIIPRQEVLSLQTSRLSRHARTSTRPSAQQSLNARWGPPCVDSTKCGFESSSWSQPSQLGSPPTIISRASITSTPTTRSPSRSMDPATPISYSWEKWMPVPDISGCQLLY